MISISNNAKKKEKEYIRKKHIFGNIIDNLNFTVNTDSSDEDEPDSGSDKEREDKGAGTSEIKLLGAS